MAARIVWSNKAEYNLQSIYQYIAADSQLYARMFIKSLVKAVVKLETLPYCGRIVPELGDSSIREVIYQNYRIVYQVNSGDTIIVLAVYHSSRDFRKTFNEDWDL